MTTPTIKPSVAQLVALFGASATATHEENPALGQAFARMSVLAAHVDMAHRQLRMLTKQITDMTETVTQLTALVTEHLTPNSAKAPDAPASEPQAEAKNEGANEEGTEDEEDPVEDMVARTLAETAADAASLPPPKPPAADQVTEVTPLARNRRKSS